MTADRERYRDLARNRKAFHLYEFLDRFEAGIALKGYEVKSARAGKIQLTDAYASVENGQLWLFQCHITPYDHHSHEGFEPPNPGRRRKLLMHRDEIKRLRAKIVEKGLTLIPLRIYLKGSLVKVELGLGRGKKAYDKRETIRRRDQERDAARELRERG